MKPHLEAAALEVAKRFSSISPTSQELYTLVEEYHHENRLKSTDEIINSLKDVIAIFEALKKATRKPAKRKARSAGSGS